LEQKVVVLTQGYEQRRNRLVEGIETKAQELKSIGMETGGIVTVNDVLLVHSHTVVYMYCTECFRRLAAEEAKELSERIVQSRKDLIEAQELEAFLQARYARLQLQQSA
jgi:hypothetical protein